MPVGDGSDGDAGFELLGAGHEIEGHGAATAPTPDAEAGGVNPGLRFEPANTGEEVGGFHRTGISRDGVFEFFADAGGGAVVDDDKDEAVVEEQLVDHEFVE